MGNIGEEQEEFEFEPIELPNEFPATPAPQETPIQVPVEPEKVPV